MTRTTADLIVDLEAIVRRNALAARVEHELEDLGLIVTDDRPYARLTAAGRDLLSRHYAASNPTEGLEIA